MGTGLGLARPESAGRVFGWFWNRTDLFLRSKPGPLAGYLDPLLTLFIPHPTLACPQLYYHRRTHSVVNPLYLSMSYTWDDTEHSIHRVQHPHRVVCPPFTHLIGGGPLNIALASGLPPYMIGRHQPTHHESSQVCSPYHLPMGTNVVTEEWTVCTPLSIHQLPPSTCPN